MKRRVTKPRVTVLAVIMTLSLGAGLYALAANTLPAPTITSGPANPTNATSATFTYTDSKPITRFDCSLDNAAFTACGTTRPSAKTYPGPLSQGPHTFQVRAVSGSDVSAAATYSWVIDRTPPNVNAINRTGANPTNASSVSWAVQFSEPVTGVDVTDFNLFRSGLGGIAVVTSVSGSGSAYTVSASTGVGTGFLRLDLVDNDTIRDLAGNPLGGAGVGNGNFQGQVYGIDKVAPPAPNFTQTPPDPAPSGDSTFAWNDAEDPHVTYQCNKENSSWFSCTTPYTYPVASTNNSQHQFAVRALDAAGNVSPATIYTWRVSPVGFSISGNPSQLLYPGVWRDLVVTITNPNSFAIQVTQLTVSASSSPSGCPASTNLAFQQSPVSSSHTVAVPPHSTVTLALADRPRIQLVDLPVNQDACKNGSFGLQYSGLATH